MSEVFESNVEITNGEWTTITLRGGEGDVVLGGKEVGGRVLIRNAAESVVIGLRGEDGLVRIGGGSSEGDPGPAGAVLIRDDHGKTTIALTGKSGDLGVGGHGADGDVICRDANDRTVIHLRGQDGLVRIGGGSREGDPGPAGVVVVRNSVGANTVSIDGEAGDIVLQNADFAEDFDVAKAVSAEATPGTVMVFCGDGALEPCAQPYDHRAAGIVCGAGDRRPGIVMDKQRDQESRVPIALVGKVFCWVEARHGAIRVGDLLTTSPLRGHAMKATDRSRAFGATLGKALAPLDAGTGLVPVMVNLQ